MTAGLQSAGKVHATSWHETHRDAADLAKRLAARGTWRGLIAVTRGGLVPAAIVARVLDIRLIETVCLSSYDGRRKGALDIVKAAPAAVADGAGWLMIDDLVDSGATAEAVRRMLPAGHYATLYAKPEGQPFVDTWLRQIDQDVWVDFPWDRDPVII